MDTKSIGTHWIAFFVNGNNAIYFDSFWVEYMPKYITADVIEYSQMIHNVWILRYSIYVFYVKR